jgi:hypothetical protein
VNKLINAKNMVKRFNTCKESFVSEKHEPNLERMNGLINTRNRFKKIVLGMKNLVQKKHEHSLEKDEWINKLKQTDVR